MPFPLRAAVPAALFAAALAAGPAQAQPPADAAAMAKKAAAFLVKSQNEDGSWGPAPNNRGVTGIVVTGLLRTGTSPDTAPVAKGLAFIESLVNAKEGHIAGNDAKAGLINYTTSINIMALSAAGRAEKYRPVVGDAVKYLKAYQWDDARGKNADTDYYGGAGYAGDK